MSTGRVHDALRMLQLGSAETASGVLKIDDTVPCKDGEETTVRQVLLEKHPKAKPVLSEALVQSPYEPVHPVRFEALTADLLKNVALHAHGSAGPSGLDSDCWRRLCSCFKNASSSLCHSLACVARLLATKEVDSEGLAPFLACRLIALDKKPGVRPIGVGEVLRRIVAKSILRVVGPDIEEACGFIQKCSGLPSGIEAAVHAMQAMYDEESTEGILLIDAANAFNNLNREAALHNVRHLCPSLALLLRNTYRSPARLFVSGGGELRSEEGTTQGDPLSMAFYALATLPLVRRLQDKNKNVRQSWYADDSGAAAKILELRGWFDDIRKEGELFGYGVNCGKSVLLVKPEFMELARGVFANTSVRIVSEGVRYLGSAIGEAPFRESFVCDKVAEWGIELDQLANIARTEPQAAYAALTHGLRGRWTYIFRTLPVQSHMVSTLDAAIQCKLLPSLCGRESFTDHDMVLLRLPARLGGIGLPHLESMCSTEFGASQEICKPQIQELLQQNSLATEGKNPFEVHKEALRSKSCVGRRRRIAETTVHKQLLDDSPHDSRRLELLSAKGASSWLTALPLKEHGFQLNKQEFRDAIALRYGWQLQSVPVKCVCGQPFAADHAMICPNGGFPSIRHNEIRDLLGTLLSEVRQNVTIEPQLLPLNGEVFQHRSTVTSDEARADIKVAGFWTRAEDAYFDVRVFHPYAPSALARSSADLFQMHERSKCLQYEERIINIDHGSFCPLIFSTTGAAGPRCDRFLKRLAGMLADEDRSPYSCTLSWLRCRISFALVRSAVMCIRGSRSSRRHPVHCLREVAGVESRIGHADQ